MFEQVIPLGSVGYIDPFSKKFVVLFNALDPATSTEPRIHHIPSILQTRGTKLVTPSAWGVLRKIGAWIKGISCVFLCCKYLSVPERNGVYSIPLPFDTEQVLYLWLGRAISRELVGNNLKIWLRTHQTAITDVFRDHHPYIQKHLALGEGIFLGYGIRTQRTDMWLYFSYIHGRLLAICLVCPSWAAPQVPWHFSTYCKYVTRSPDYINTNTGTVPL